ASPVSVHPTTTMPDVLGSRPQAEREKIAEALTHFLVAQSPKRFSADCPENIDREQGKTLYHSIGCVACHGPREPLAEAPPIQPVEDDEEEDPLVKAKRAFKPIAV